LAKTTYRIEQKEDGKMERKNDKKQGCGDEEQSV
jgi:hypothetical protein